MVVSLFYKSEYDTRQNMKKSKHNSSMLGEPGHCNLETTAHVHREPNGNKASFHQDSCQRESEKNHKIKKCHFDSITLQNGQPICPTDVSDKSSNGQDSTHVLRAGYPRRTLGFYAGHHRCFCLDPSTELRRIQLERDNKRPYLKETSKANGDIKSADKISVTNFKSVGQQNKAFQMDESEPKFQLVPLNREGQENVDEACGNGSVFQRTCNIEDNKDQKTQVPENKRDKAWGSKYDLFVVTITYMIGLGNVLRFSKLCLDNGGGAFLIPYVIMLLFAGIPLVCLEMSVGQRAGHHSPLKSWGSLGPNLKWIGFATVMNSLICSFYYCLMVTWCFYYFCFSLTNTLPWKNCPEATDLGKGNYSSILTANSECEAANPAKYFWFRSTLDVSDSISHSNGFNGKLYGFLLVTWIIVWLLVMKGLRTTSRTLYVLLFLIVTLLVVLFFVGVHLEGWAQGLAVFFIPKIEQLKDPQVWLDAAGQIVFSLGIGYGGISTFASLNQPQNDFFTDSIFCAVANAGTSIWSSIIMFSFFGFKANYHTRKCLSKMNSTSANHSNCDMSIFLSDIQGGTSLAFIDMSEAFTEFDTKASFWSALFYLLLFLLGSTSLLGMLQVIYSTVIEMEIFPSHWRQEVIYGVICLAICIGNLVFSLPNGYYIHEVIDNSTIIPLLLIALFECLGVSYFYGMNRFNDDIKRLTGKDIKRKWKICWQFISPLIALVLVIAGIVKTALKGGFTYRVWDSNKGTEVEQPYPPWTYILYAVLAVIPIVFIVIVLLKNCCVLRSCQSHVGKLRETCQNCMTSHSGSYAVTEDSQSDPSWTQNRNLNGFV